MTIPTKELLSFRNWIEQNRHQGSDVRQAAALLAQSSVVRRMLEANIETTLNLYNSSELLNMLAFAGFDHFAEYLLKLSFSRAIVEDDQALLEVFSKHELIIEQQQWYHRLLQCDEATATQLLATEIESQEQRAMTRLILGRQFPQLIQSHWLKDTPQELPQIGYALCRLMLQVEQDFVAAVYIALQGRPDIFLYYEPDPLFSTLVLRCQDAPQKVLAPFEGYYGEQTVLAAAQWHIEHNQPQAALELCKTIRPLSAYADQAYLIGGTACLELQNLQGALDAEQQILNRHVAENLIINIARQHPEAVSNQQLKAIALEHNSGQAESFFAVLNLLLQRKDIASAKELCFAQQETFLDHPSIKPIMDVVLKGASAAPSIN